MDDYRRRTGFTLIELLTVIAVVAILASILISVLGQVREKAQQVNCISNLRSLQTASNLYSLEHKGMLVPVYRNLGGNGAGGVTGRVTWHNDRVFMSYLSQQTGQSNWQDGFLCPASLLDRAITSDLYYSYGMNATNMPGSWTTPGSAAQVGLHMIRNPSRTIAFADAVDWMITMAGADRYVGEVYAQQAVAYRHNGKANVVFFDGSTASLSRESMVNNEQLWRVTGESR